MKQFFTLGAGALDETGVHDAALQDVFEKSVAVVTADGAPYAQKACRLLGHCFVNLRAVVRDRAHAIVGAMKNASEVDHFVTEFKEMVTTGPESVCKRVTHNSGFRERFERACTAQAETAAEPVPLLCSLRYGKARFASQVDPERRILLQLLGTLYALRKHASEASDAKDRAWAEARLRYFTFERVAVMAAITDAEAYCLKHSSYSSSKQSSEEQFCKLICQEITLDFVRKVTGFALGNSLFHFMCSMGSEL